MRNLSLSFIISFLCLISNILLSQNVILSKNPVFQAQSYLSGQVEAEMEQNNISAVSASILKNGKEIWNLNSGLANRESNLEASDSVMYLMYSTTKLFTGIGIMQLWEQDYFALDDPVGDYLPFSLVHPSYPDTKITFRMLMSHVSGIIDNGSVFNNLMVFNHDTPVSLQEFCYNYFSEDGSYYGANTTFSNKKPGTTWQYSNTAITLLGYLIEVISGEEYTEYINEHILAPLEMNRSTFYLAELDMELLAQEYIHNGYNYIPKGFRSCPMFPAGFMHSPRIEIRKFQEMLLNNGRYMDNVIIESSTLDLMQSLHYPQASSFQGLVFAYNSVYNLWGHSGGYNQNMKTHVYHSNDEKWGVSMLCNGAGDPWGLVGKMYAFAREHKCITIEHITIEDDGDLILGSNETIKLKINFRNNTLENLNDIRTELINTNSLITINKYHDTINGFPSCEVSAEPANFLLQTKEITEGFNQNFSIRLYENNILLDSLSFDIYFGNADVLVINDESNWMSDKADAISYYESSVENAGYRARPYNINRLNFPDVGFLENFEAVIWFTGMDNTEENQLLSEAKQNLISNYLDKRGRLFLSSQNVGDAIGESDFFHHYLHSNHISDSYEGILKADGTEGNEIGDDLHISLTGGSGSNNQDSPSVIEPIDGATTVFEYEDSEICAGIMFTDPFQLVFLPFAYEAIASEENRNELMERILRFLTITVEIEDIEENSKCPVIFPNPSNGMELKLAPQFKTSEINIYNVMGKLVFHKNADNPEIRNPQLQTGIYFIEARNSTETFLQKLIVTR